MVGSCNNIETDKKDALLPFYEYAATILNLQGINFIFTAIPDIFSAPWFFTVIMLCYASLIIVKRIEKQHGDAMRKIVKMGGLPLAITCVLSMFRVNISGILAFYIGYVLKKKDYGYKKYNCFLMILVAGLAAGVRLVAKRFLDETIVYNLIVSITQICIAAAAFMWIKWLLEACRFTTKIVTSKLFSHLDKVSLYVYVCHRWFFDGTILRMFDYGLPMTIALILYLVAVVTFATIFRWGCIKIEEGIVNLSFRRKVL